MIERIRRSRAGVVVCHGMDRELQRYKGRSISDALGVSSVLHLARLERGVWATSDLLCCSFHTQRICTTVPCIVSCAIVDLELGKLLQNPVTPKFRFRSSRIAHGSI